jgi:NAD(P)-dependent dehydrogenase (short-subunit alcohol dehydrogenase family)
MVTRPLDGRVALVTGAGRGLGRHMATWLAEDGARVVVCARSQPGIDDLASELRAGGAEVLAQQCDVADAGAVAELVANATNVFGGIDIAVANAAILGPVGPIDVVDGEQWMETLTVNVGGVAALVRAVLPSMRARGWGRLLTLSGAGAGGPNLPEHVSAYVASKAAVMMLTEVLAKELPAGVTINSIAPGAVPTGFMQEVLDRGPAVAGDALYESVKAQTMPDLSPLRALLAYVVSDESAWCSGRCLSARWDPPEALRALAGGIGDSRLRLRRIDEDLYGTIGAQA